MNQKCVKLLKNMKNETCKLTKEVNKQYKEKVITNF